MKPERGTMRILMVCCIVLWSTVLLSGCIDKDKASTINSSETLYQVTQATTPEITPMHSLPTTPTRREPTQTLILNKTGNMTRQEN